MKTSNFINGQAIILTLTLMISCIVVEAQQQQTSAETTMTSKFGIKGGLNFANLYIDNAKDEHIKLGGNIGFYAKLPWLRVSPFNLSYSTAQREQRLVTTTYFKVQVNIDSILIM